MAEAIVKFSLQRLKSVLLEENQKISSLEDQTQILISLLDEIGGFFESTDGTTGKNCELETRWFRELIDIVYNMEDCIDNFVVHMENQSASDQTILIDQCKIELENLEKSLLHVRNQMLEDKKGKAVKPESLDVEENTSKADAEPGEASSSPTSFKVYLSNLPYFLQSCLKYCCIFPENYAIPKGRLVRLLVAEGLIQEKPGQIAEDIAKENIKELANLGVLHVDGNKLKVPETIRAFMLCMMGEEGFIVSCTSSDTNVPPTTRRLSIHLDANNIPDNLNNLPLRSLFLFGIRSLSDAALDSLRPVFHEKKFLRVLDLEDVHIKNIPDELGDMIHLRYLGLKNSDIDALPESVTNLRNLQTLDIRWNGKITDISSSILKLVQLRHLKMFKNWGINGVREILVPTDIGRSENLQTFTGLYAGGGIAAALGNLTQLKRLGVMDVAADHVNDLSVSIMKMKGLHSLSLEAKSSYASEVLPSFEPFSPPPDLQKLRLGGRLEKMPSWFSLMGNLIKLRLGFSHLSEDPALVLQFLPNLKHLTLWRAYDGKQIGKEFCGVGGFPKLEVLVIASHVLEEWTELEEGALPNLKYLHMHNCLRLRTLPEGLQHITTLQELKLIPLLDDHVERLKPDGGEENHKIRNIPLISFMPTSVVEQLMRGHPAGQCA
ncbi:hypothetical protein IFM89_010703 [Coptis chinensis]|uniref:Rx N-terminal domain-containing protein n=1 Tax=Coptis chinensis TaxID=261450 RepID=A0A835IQZ6_9MAGN|nr:hypothetical protein IFM89_010703 [Coptis chinensis]